MVSSVLVRRYYISTGVPQPSASSSNPNMHFKASKHQLLLNHNIFGCVFAVYCLYKYGKAVFKLSSDSASITLDGDYGNFGSGRHKFSPPSPLQTHRSLRGNNIFFFLFRADKGARGRVTTCEGRHLVLSDRKPSWCASHISAWQLTVAGNDPEQKPPGKRAYEVVVSALEPVLLTGEVAPIRRDGSSPPSFLRRGRGGAKSTLNIYLASP